MNTKTKGVAALSATMLALAASFAFAAQGMQSGRTGGGQTGDPVDPAAVESAPVDPADPVEATEAVAAHSADDSRSAEDPTGHEALWRARLTLEDLDRREAHFDELVAELAQGGERLRAIVRAWHEQGGELAWTARLALRAAEQRAARAGTAPFLDSEDGWPALPGFGADFDRMMRDMESLQQRFLGSDPLFGAPGGLGGRGAGRLPLGFDFDAFGGGPSSSTTQSSQLSFQQGPDGVRVEVTEEVDGERSTTVYEAETPEALLEAHPELRKRLGSLVPGSSEEGGKSPAPRSFGARPQGLRLWFGDRFGGLDPRSSQAEGPRTDRLGLLVRELSPHAPLERVDGEPPLERGLVVERVHRDSLGQALGLRQGDVLIELNGKRVATPADVARVLAERATDAVLRARLIDAQGNPRDVAWDPAEGPPGARGPGEDPESGARLLFGALERTYDSRSGLADAPAPDAAGMANCASHRRRMRSACWMSG